MTEADVIVIGGGIAGVSVAAELSRARRVVLLERETQPAFHATGRSAALFSEIYGGPPIRALSRASRAFFTGPPDGFADAPLVTPRGSLFIARPDQGAALAAFAGEADVAGATRMVSAAEAIRLSPLLRPDYVDAGILEPDSADIDVHGLLTGYLRLLKANGGVLVAPAPVTALEPGAAGWRATTPAGAFTAPVVINAAGAWADEVAALAGLRPLGLQPLRRTALTVEAPQDAAVAAAPLTIDIDEQFYFKPDAGRLLLSPADETPNPPCDVQPDEWDVAVAVDRVETATRLQVRRIQAKWAGLRTFAPDRAPVIGFDPRAPGFFWLAGQGGYGIQTAPANARLAAALALGAPPPPDIAEAGLDLETVSPARLAGRAEAD
ncbi:MAG: FAD-binding oxidoreductase [Caulobacteraceae bacterium]|nr:FAD-binding oxidoreductase [Caulobacteraceae bacterium]